MTQYDDLGFEPETANNPPANPSVNQHSDLGFVAESQPREDVQARIVPGSEQLADSAVSRFGTGLYQTTIGPIADLATHNAENIRQHGATLGPFKTMWDIAQGTVKASNEEGMKTLQALKNMDFGTAIQHLPGIIPMVGPAAVKASEEIQKGNVAGGLGQATGLVGTVAATEGAGNIKQALGNRIAGMTGELPERMYQSALKPSLSARNLPKIQGQVATGLKEAIPVSNAGVSKISGLIRDLRQTITNTIKSNPEATISPEAVGARLKSSGKGFGEQVLPNADLDAIAAARSQWLNRFVIRDSEGNITGFKQIPVEEAQGMKQGTYRVNAKKYNELSSAQMEAEKALARGIKEELENIFPDLKGLNAREGALIELRNQLVRAVGRTKNWEVFTPGLYGTLGGIGVGAAAGWEAGGATAAVMSLLRNPVVKSRLAIALTKAAKNAGNPISTRAAYMMVDSKALQMARSLEAINASIAGQRLPSTENVQVQQ